MNLPARPSGPTAAPVDAGQTAGAGATWKPSGSAEGHPRPRVRKSDDRAYGLFRLRARVGVSIDEYKGERGQDRPSDRRGERALGAPARISPSHSPTDSATLGGADPGVALVAQLSVLALPGTRSWVALRAPYGYLISLFTGFQPDAAVSPLHRRPCRGHAPLVRARTYERRQQQLCVCLTDRRVANPPGGRRSRPFSSHERSLWKMRFALYGPVVCGRGVSDLERPGAVHAAVLPAVARRPVRPSPGVSAMRRLAVLAALLMTVLGSAAMCW